MFDEMLDAFAPAFTIVNMKMETEQFLMFFVIPEPVDSDDEKLSRRKADRG